MEFRFNVNEIFKQPIVQVGHTLIPQGFKGDRRALWDTLSKVTDIVNAMGSASATAQGLTKPITSADRLRNSENQNLYLLIEPSAYNGKGAVTGLLKTGQKGLYVFDRDGHHYHVQAPCILDFYVHESRQRTGFGKTLFEHMLQKETVHPEKLAIDRPSDKFLGFLKKHYSLVDPIKQMNNYVVYDGFFPNVKEMEASNNNSNSPNKNMRGANGLQAQIVTSPYGRYGAPRPACSMGQIIHNQSSAVAAQEPTGLNIRPDEQPRCAPRVINKGPVEPCAKSSGEPVTTSTVSATNISRVATVGNGLGDKSPEPIIATGQMEQPPQEPSLQYYWPFAKPAEEYPSIDKSQLHAKPCCDTIHELITNQCTHQQPPKPQKVPTDDIGIPIMQKKEHAQQRRLHSAGLNSTLHSSSKRLQTNSLLDDVGSYRTLLNSFSKEGEHYFQHPSLANLNQPYSYYKTAPVASQSQTKVLSRRPSKLQAIPEQDGQQARSPSQQHLHHVERIPSSTHQQHISEESQKIIEQPSHQSYQNIHQHHQSVNQQNINQQQQQGNLTTDNVNNQQHVNTDYQQQNITPDTLNNQQQHQPHTIADGLQTNLMAGNMINNQQQNIMNNQQQQLYAMQGNLNNQQAIATNMNNQRQGNMPDTFINQQQPYANANNQQRVINYANYQQQPYYNSQLYYQPQQQMMPPQQQQYYNPYMHRQQQQQPMNVQQTAQQQVEVLQAQQVEQPLQEQPVLEGKPEEISESGQGERVVNQKESKVKINEPYKQEIGQGERRNELADFRQEEQITGTQEQTVQQQPDRIPLPANQQGEIDENVAEKETPQPQESRPPQETAPPATLQNPNAMPLINQQYMMNQMQPALMQQQQQQQYADLYGNQNVPQRMMLQGTTVQNQNYPRMQPCEPPLQMMNPQQISAHQSEASQKDPVAYKNTEEAKTQQQASSVAEMQQQQLSNNQQIDMSQQQQYPSPQQNEHRQGLDHESLRNEPEKMKPESVPYLEPIYPVTPSRTNQMSAKSSNSNRPRSFVGSQHNIPNAMQRTSKVCQSEEAKAQKLTKENQHKRPQQSVNSLQRNITSALRKSQIGANFERQSKIFNALENDMTESKLRLISPKATGESQETPQPPPQQDEAKALEAPPLHPKLDRPQTLSLQTSTDEGMNNIKNDVEEVEETLKIETVPKIVDELDKLHISREKEAIDEHSTDTPQKKATPSHLTDQGFFDLKFYHNKLW